ncbi:hypothetical protein P4313_16605 [Bacillus tropicus]|uniref:hypothetical protein n=1 Tax=Bacillus cereus group TaxID=86661 RepID=UPI0015E158F1|nr:MULTISPECIES: hypothetical protein [Bacillus cereus group]MED3036647.1 hypothetical protein [Bacillus tropicus]
MPKVQDIFRLTVGRNCKERKLSQHRKPIAIIDGVPLYPITAKEGRELGEAFAEGFAKGIESAQGEQRLIGIDFGSPMGSFSALPMAREQMTVQSYGRSHETYKDEVLKELYKDICIGIRMDGVR